MALRGAAVAVAVVGLAGLAAARSSSDSIATVVIDVAGGPRALFRPDEALGVDIDGMQHGEVDRLFTPFNIARMRGAGLEPVSYRLRTELAIEAWHWSEEGAWSDQARHRGYWTSSDQPKKPVLISWGYALPRRGDTIDQANDAGYSRLDDGDTATFWKSNPYLDRRYAGGAAERPQWVVVDLGKVTGVDTAVIRWSEPFATRFEVQHWTGGDPYDEGGRWTTFLAGAIENGGGGVETLQLAAAPVPARYLRLRLETSSRTAPPGSTDPRDAMGFAIAEVSFGVETSAGGFENAVRHGPGRHRQSTIYVSSTDPWHRASDRDPNVEQPGLDRLFASGAGSPVMIPVGALYDTPENAAAEIRYLGAKGYPFRQVEIGEEPDGQNVSPEDFAALYRQFARAVRAANGEVAIGGPSLQEPESDTWLDDAPDHSWTHRFVEALEGEGGAPQLDFLSFEQYPFDDLCGSVAAKLVTENAIMSAAIARLRSDAAPVVKPLIISEYGLSAYGGRAELGMPAALVNADIVAQFLSEGGAAAYLFGYGPAEAYMGARPCAGAGNLMLFHADAAGGATRPTPAYWGARMLGQEWAQAGHAQNALFAARLVPSSPPDWVTAYANLRPDGAWSVLIVNRDERAGHAVRIMVATKGRPRGKPLPGPYDVVQFGPGEAAPRRLRMGAARPLVRLPPWSLTVVKTSQEGQNSGV